MTKGPARGLIAAGISLFLTLLLLAATGAPPFESLAVIFEGAFGSPQRVADTLMAWAPLALAAAGLVVTFAAGLWNIGVEGQVTAGAIAASFVARELPGPAAILIPCILIAGAVGGALWGLLAGLLKVKGNVNEIFGGLGLGFVAQSLATFLVIGPWKRAGIASTSGTDPFRDEAWLPTIGGTRLAPIALVLALAGLAAVAYALKGTRFGLRLRAVGSNPASARLLGVPPQATILRAFLVGGGMAGLAGAVIAAGIQHKLIPAISGGRGYLAILVVLLAGFRAAWVGPVAVFFAAISTGAAQLQLQLDLDSSLGGVIQGILVLVFLLTGGLLSKWQSRRGVADG